MVFMFFHPDKIHINKWNLLDTIIKIAGFLLLLYASKFLIQKTLYERVLKRMAGMVESGVTAEDIGNEFFQLAVEWKLALYYYEKKMIAPYYEGPIGDFTFASIPAEWKLMAKARLTNADMLSLLSRLESMAADLVSGRADRSKVIDEIGKSFCTIVSKSYDLVSFQRADKSSPLYHNIIELYSLLANKRR